MYVEMNVLYVFIVRTRLYVCMYVCMYVSTYVGMCICTMSSCMYVCIYVCMYVCGNGYLLTTRSFAVAPGILPHTYKRRK